MFLIGLVFFFFIFWPILRFFWHFLIKNECDYKKIVLFVEQQCHGRKYEQQCHGWYADADSSNFLLLLRLKIKIFYFWQKKKKHQKHI